MDDNLSISEFIQHPDYQQISSFFLGAVFITSLNYSYTWIKSFFPRFKRWISKKQTNDIENIDSEKVSIASSLKSAHRWDNQSLVFTLSLCFAFASIAYFGSLLTFSPNDGGALCAFVVAWGGMAAQTARLVGLVILLIEEKELGITRLEFFGTFSLLFVDMILVFVNNAIGTGALRLYAPLHVAICYRKHFLPTALATSLMTLILEFFIIFRLGMIIRLQRGLTGERGLVLTDYRIIQGLCLLLLDLLTIVPSAKHISVLADFIPLSIGALIVLVAFNSRPPGRDIDPAVTIQTGSPSLFLQQPPASSTREGWLRRSRSFVSSFHHSSQRRTAAPRTPPPMPSTIPHPFSAQYLNTAARQVSRMISSDSIRVVEEAFNSGRNGPSRTLRDGANRQQSTSKAVQQNSNTTVMEEEETVSSSTTPTSILMHPWHEKRQVDDEVTSPKSAKSASNRASYMFRGYSMPMGPTLSPPAAVQRYSSSTLTSPLFSQEGGEEVDGRQHVKLLTFESTFRSKRDRVKYADPLPSAGSVIAPR